MTEIAIRDGAMPAKIAYAQELAQSGLLPAAFRKQPANVLFALEYGEMLGLPGMAAITGVHVIEGKPTASAKLIAALVRRAGHALRVTGDDRRAVCEIVRRDDPDFTFRAEWTIERAKQAKLTGKQVWQQYPTAMLKARSISEAANDACPELLFGLVASDEISAGLPAPSLTAAPVDDGAPVTAAELTGEVVEARIVEPDELETPATAAQNRKMHALFREAELGDDRDARLQLTGLLLGRHIDTSKGLTVADADSVIDQLTAIRNAGHADGLAGAAADLLNQDDLRRDAEAEAERLAEARIDAEKAADVDDTRGDS